MQKLMVIASLVVTAGLLPSGGDTDAGVSTTKPTTVLQQGFQVPTFTVAQSTLFASPVRKAFCPAFPPFAVVIPISISAAAVPLTITEINLRFVNTLGIPMRQTTLRAPVLTTPLASALCARRM